MSKQLVVAALSNEIYLANINKNGMMSDSGREVVTDQVIQAMFQHMKKLYDRTGKTKYIIDGFGQIEFTPLEDDTQ
ncbi:DUF7446 family protein [Ornithinibacillus xuwenensis]|uniref:Uncharacterized protein n=1 Tax=Ornithinibacillus xuwenensis TaxID=3144668 RepID=A0ABU9XBX0_9BACI